MEGLCYTGIPIVVGTDASQFPVVKQVDLQEKDILSYLVSLSNKVNGITLRTSVRVLSFGMLAMPSKQGRSQGERGEIPSPETEKML